jgi:hypothetical protein
MITYKHGISLLILGIIIGHEIFFKMVQVSYGIIIPTLIMYWNSSPIFITIGRGVTVVTSWDKYNHESK